MTHANLHTPKSDPIVDEVRAIRQAIVAACDNDLDKLFAELKRTESDFKARSGIFAALGRLPSAQSVADRWKKAKAG